MGSSLGTTSLGSNKILMKTNLIIALLVLNFSSIIAQNVKLGFRIEPAVLISEKENLFTPISAYANILYKPIDYLTIELRPGFLYAGEDYAGFEIGAFAKFRIVPTKFLIIVGLNNHSNAVFGRNGSGSYEKNILYKGIGFGYQIDEKLSFDLMYYFSNNSDYAYSLTLEGNDLIYHNTKMVGILKFGFSLAWDIFKF
jgi:hypothetical protein